MPYSKTCGSIGKASDLAVTLSSEKKPAAALDSAVVGSAATSSHPFKAPRRTLRTSKKV